MRLIENDVKHPDFSKHYGKLTAAKLHRQEGLEFELLQTMPGKFPDFINHMGFIICSEKIRTIFEGVPGLRFNSMTIKDKKGSKKEGYYNLVLPIIEGKWIDRDKSILSLDDGLIVRIKSLVLKQGIENKLFILGEYADVNFVHESYYETLQGLKNIKLAKADGWSENRF